MEDFPPTSPPPPSLVDIRSTPDNIIDHWHRLVDCQEKVLSPSWAVVKLVEQPYGWVTFCSLGVVKTLERERAREVGERGHRQEGGARRHCQGGAAQGAGGAGQGGGEVQGGQWLHLFHFLAD